MGNREGPLYSPLLKAKQAEFDAMKLIAPEVLTRLMPLVEVPPSPRDRETRKRKPIREHLAPIPPKLAKAWTSDAPLLLDVPHLDAAAIDDEPHPVRQLFDEVLECGLAAVPVVGLDRGLGYEKAIAEAAAAHGLAIRLVDADLADLKSLDYELRRLLARLSLDRDAVDIVIDARHVSKDDVATRTEGLRSILGRFPTAKAWRSTTVMGGAFPASLANLRANNLRRIRRADLELWQGLVASDLGRTIRFGDYGIDNPTPFDPENPKAIQVSANVRYTSADAWVVVKGTSTKKFGWEQTRRLCEVIVARPEFMGADYSVGDAHIEKRSRGVVTCGNPTTWRRVGLVHHLTLTSDQLSMYGAP